jgi:hypothetical protein
MASYSRSSKYIILVSVRYESRFFRKSFKTLFAISLLCILRFNTQLARAALRSPLVYTLGEIFCFHKGVF